MQVTQDTFERGELRVRWPRPDVLVTSYLGYLDLAGATRIRELRQRGLGASGRIEEFHDWSSMTGYSTAARNFLTRASHDDRARLRHIHVFAYAKLVRMGLTAAAVTLRTLLTTYDESNDFERALERCIAAD